MSKLWRQLFICMTEVKGKYIPCAFGYLPSKEFEAYYVFLFMLVYTFCGYKKMILKVYAKSKLKVRRVKLDFEWSIHAAFGMFEERIIHKYFEAQAQVYIRVTLGDLRVTIGYFFL